MGRCPGKRTGRSNLCANRLLSFRQGNSAHDMFIPRLHEVKRMRRTAHKSFTCSMSWPTRRAGGAQSRRTAAGLLLGLACLLVLTACGATSHQRVLYESSGIQVGIITDLSTKEDASSPVKNRHPVDLTPQDIRSLIGSLEVSGWSGTITGLFSNHPPRPVFTEAELAALAEPLAAAFHAATPRERVFFAIKNQTAPYETDRTSGNLFFRDEYLHVILTDHSSPGCHRTE